MSLEVINNTLKELAPALAVSGIGLSLLFQVLRLTKEDDAGALAAISLVGGFILIVVGILALFASAVAAGYSCVALLCAVGFVTVCIVVYFLPKKARRKK